MNGKALIDSKSLKDYVNKDGATIHLMRKPTKSIQDHNRKDMNPENMQLDQATIHTTSDTEEENAPNTSTKFKGKEPGFWVQLERFLNTQLGNEVEASKVRNLFFLFSYYFFFFSFSHPYLSSLFIFIFLYPPHSIFSMLIIDDIFKNRFSKHSEKPTII